MDTSKLLTIDHCESVVRKYLNVAGVKPISIVTEGTKFNNFLIKITVQSNDNEKKTLNYFAKPATSENRALANKILFEDFKRIIPTFDQKITPRIYYGTSNVQLFEDLTWQGFEAKVGHLDLDQLQVTLGILAKFHAGSLAYADVKTRQLNREFILGDEYKLDTLNWDKKDDLEAVSHLLNPDVVQKIPEFLNELHNKRQNRTFKQTICHINLKLDNIMFKSENGKPITCKLINFKPTYAPPVYDVLQLIFLNSTSHLRQHHLDSLLRYYFNNLKIEVEKYSLNIDKILTLDELLLSAHYILPLIKLEVVQLAQDNSQGIKELAEIISCPRLTREDCYVIAKNSTGTTSYEFVSFQVLPIDETNGFLGDYLKLNIQIKHQSQDKVINCFVKFTPQSNKLAQEIISGMRAFTKEIFFYETLVPLFQKYEINIINECVPRCYLRRDGDLMVFENLDSQDYKLLSPLKGLTLQTLSVVLQKLAKFHASTIIFEEKKSRELGQLYRLIDDYSEHISEVFFVKEATQLGAKLWQTGLKAIPDVLNLLPDLKESPSGKRLLDNFATLSERFYESVKPSRRSRNTLNHGDMWTHNILFKQDNNVTVNCRFVDFQITRYCSPAQDFLCAVHVMTDRETRLKHEREFQTIYYDELTKVLGDYNYAIDEIYPYGQFIDSVELLKLQVTMQTVMYDTFGALCTPEDIASLLGNDEESSRKVFFGDRRNYVKGLFAKSDLIRSRIRGDVEDLLDVVDQLEL